MGMTRADLAAVAARTALGCVSAKRIASSLPHFKNLAE
jgi:hypothetical protein